MAEALGLASSVIAVIDLSAKIVSWCSTYYANVKNARDDIKRLQGETQRLSEILKQVRSLCDSPNGAKLQASQNLRDGIMECEIQLAQLETKLAPRTRQKMMRRIGVRALTWPFKTNEVDSIIKKLGSCKDTISFNLQVNQTHVISIIVKILTIHQEIVFNKLKSANDAVFDSYAEEHNARCYQGTRVQLLQQIDTWASDLGSECIFWLNGMAGTGKSTISRTVAQNLSAKGELGASFFFKRGEGDRGHSGLLFATIATQLVQRLPSLAPHVQDAIEADPAISTKAQKQQLDKLILQPISKLTLDPQKLLRMVIVIDALDECDREEDTRAIIRLLSQVKATTSLHLKFFLTSRPELPIRLGFGDIHGRYEGLALHQIPIAVIREDISAFLEHELAMIRDDYNKSVNPTRRLSADWPGESIHQSLVRMAIPLFIFATTICRFINDRKCGQPKDQLARVLQYEMRSQASKLDATYLPVLEQLLVGVSLSEKRDIVAKFQQVVGSIIILARPLSATSLDLLLGLPEGTTDSRVDLLHSVLSIPSDPNLPIRLLHLSFRDFLVDTEKCEINPFWVDEKEAHKELASRCLLRLTTSGYLKKDICDLRVPERLWADIDQQTIDIYLPPDIQYACQYWVYHLKECGNIIYDNDQVYNFLKCHFLHWLEALSLIGRILESISMIDELIAIVDLSAGIKVSALLYDAKRFILTHLSIAESSPLQLYSAALIFSPKDSIIRNLYQNYIPNWILLQPKVESGWNNVLQTLEGHNSSIRSVAFSHNSKLLASASDDTTIKVWDTATGSLQQTLEGHSGSVRSVAFSHDSKLLVSASVDTTIKVWDTATGSLQQTLEGHSDWVRSVAFSHDSKLLASASDDKTIKIWDTAIGSLQQTLEGHSEWIRSVAFSHDSKLLASASDDKTIKVWDTATGSLQQLLKGHSRSVNSVAFSNNSKLLASASDDTTIKIWDTATGSLQQTLEGHNIWVYSVAFSHNSNLLASASGYGIIKIWDTATGSLQQTLVGHSDSVTSVVYSHNSKLLTSASVDKTIKIWDTAIGSLQQTLEGHSAMVNSVVFSHDSKLLASASSDKTIKVWDTATGSLQQTLEGHSSWVNSVAFSHNSKLLASTSEDKTIKVWDTATGSLQQLLKGHYSLVKSVVFSHDSKLLASASVDKTIKIWDTVTGSLQQTLEDHENWVTSVAFSHNSKLLASVSQDWTVKIWDTATGSLQQTLKGYSGSVSSVAFSHDSKLLASVSDDQTVKIWDIATGSLQQTIKVNNYISSLLFDSIDSSLITNIGRIRVRRTKLATLSNTSQKGNSKSDREGLGISGSWVTWNGENLLWLPPDYRGWTSNISPSYSTVALGCQAGKVIVMGFSLANIRNSYLDSSI
ncbi:vegetative incompatibility HET-E-1 protein [Rutstroemia sp. NJR-2017a BVV2]|nr:vegetative incompatibility HET-E-1 protein [Rutstroemia sp. NJR-2017a BVV2]